MCALQANATKYCLFFCEILGKTAPCPYNLKCVEVKASGSSFHLCLP